MKPCAVRMLNHVSSVTQTVHSASGSAVCSRQQNDFVREIPGRGLRPSRFLSAFESTKVSCRLLSVCLEAPAIAGGWVAGQVYMYSRLLSGYCAAAAPPLCMRAAGLLHHSLKRPPYGEMSGSSKASSLGRLWHAATVRCCSWPMPWRADQLQQQ
jgi:hypothetical protein